MAACNQFDLLRLGSDNPIVDVVLGKHKVKSITSLETGMVFL